MRILITGCNGFIGRNLSQYFGKQQVVDTVSRNDLDLLDYNAVQQFFDSRHYHLVIHTAVEGGRRTKLDGEEIVHRNILMVYNLLANQDHFDRMITFGSGAELDRRFDINENTDENKRYPIDYYGMSKSIIHKLCLVEPKLYNFRIFNCFGSDEDSERMLRRNIESYIRREPLTLFSNRLMDFFYVDDLALMVDYFLKNPTFSHKTINCTYGTHTRLREILDIVNSLSDYTVPIIEKDDLSSNMVSGMNTDYIGSSSKLPLDFIGLEMGIKKMYRKIIEKASCE